MLVLKRNPGERITIGDDIVVIQLADGRIGIEAPGHLKILRSELRGQPVKDLREHDATT